MEKILEKKEVPLIGEIFNKIRVEFEEQRDKIKIIDVTDNFNRIRENLNIIYIGNEILGLFDSMKESLEFGYYFFRDREEAKYLTLGDLRILNNTYENILMSFLDYWYNTDLGTSTCDLLKIFNEMIEEAKLSIKSEVELEKYYSEDTKNHYYKLYFYNVEKQEKYTKTYVLKRKVVGQETMIYHFCNQNEENECYYAEEIKKEDLEKENNSLINAGISLVLGIADTYQKEGKRIQKLDISYSDLQKMVKEEILPKIPKEIYDIVEKKILY